MEIYTIGFGGRTAEQFFEPLKQAGIQELVDVRLNNISQLAGFTKKSDLPYFLARIANVGYRHEPLLAPLPEMLKEYRAKQLAWADYEALYLDLLRERNVAALLQPTDFPDKVVFLCSEAKPEKCHRRLAAEYLQAAWQDVRIEHL